MALPTTDGYQLTDGNLNQLILGTQASPATTTNTTTLTTTQLIPGVILATPTGAASYTLPTGNSMDGAISSLKVGTAIDFSIINTSAYDITMVAASGFSLGGGSATISANTSGAFRARRLGTNSWTVYRIWG